MTASGTEEPTIGIDQTAALTAARGGVAAVSTDDASGVTSSGWWVGPAEDPDRYELLGAGITGGEGTTYQASSNWFILHYQTIQSRHIMKG